MQLGCQDCYKVVATSINFHIFNFIAFAWIAKYKKKKTQIHGQQLNISRKMLHVDEYEKYGPLRK
jgi:hypothetical protein